MPFFLALSHFYYKECGCNDWSHLRFGGDLVDLNPTGLSSKIKEVRGMPAWFCYPWLCSPVLNLPPPHGNKFHIVQSIKFASFCLFLGLGARLTQQAQGQLLIQCLVGITNYCQCSMDNKVPVIKPGPRKSKICTPDCLATCLSTNFLTFTLNQN